MSTNTGTGLTNQTEHYQYPGELSGESIRLIKLLHDHYLEQLSCSIVCKGLNEKDLEYNVLFYVWGDRSVPAFIECDGLPLRITQNLYQALSYVKRTRSDTLL